MASNKLLNNLPDCKELNLRVFDLVIGRVLKRAYLDFDEKVKEDISKTFLLGDDKEKENFIKKNIPNFKEFFKEELKNINKEIKAEIEKQILKIYQ